jgi:hypothetical protein
MKNFFTKARGGFARLSISSGVSPIMGGGSGVTFPPRGVFDGNVYPVMVEQEVVRR